MPAAEHNARVDWSGCARRGRYHTPHVEAIEQLPGDSSVYDIAVGRPRRTTSSKRPTHPADAAQAGLFTAILQSELTELDSLAATLEVRCSDLPDHRLAKQLLRVNARSDEVRRLMDALRDRFPEM